jgi:hypothetical protein
VIAIGLVAGEGGCGRLLYDPQSLTVPDASTSDAGRAEGDASSSLDGAIGIDASDTDAPSGDASDTDAADTDAADSDAGGPDASVRPACDWSAGPALGPATAITLSITSDPVLARDGASLYHANFAGSPSSSELYVAPRTSPTSFGTARAITELSTRGDEFRLVVSADGLYALLSRDAGGAPDILEVTRPSATAPWGTAVAIPAITTAGPEWDPHLSPDGLRLWFSRSCDLFVSQRATRSSAWETATPLTELSTADCETSPTLTDDELVIVFLSDAAEGPGMGDAWYATRASADLPFDAPILVPAEANTASIESEPFVRGDGCELLWLSERSGTRRLYVAPIL